MIYFEDSNKEISTNERAKKILLNKQEDANKELISLKKEKG